jgi:hypothetical protein
MNQQTSGSHSNDLMTSAGYLILRLDIRPFLQQERYDLDMTSIGSIVDWCLSALRK